MGANADDSLLDKRKAPWMARTMPLELQRDTASCDKDRCQEGKGT